MKGSRQQVWVGVFVLIVVLLLIGVVTSVSGAFASKGIPHRTYFRYAAGMAPGTPVRYGGLLVGRLNRLRVDPQDSTRIEVDFEVAPEIPVKTNSLAKITTLGMLGENYLEITTGTKDAPMAQAGSILQSREAVTMADLTDLVGGMAPTVDQVLHSLNDRLAEVKVTVAAVNDLVGESNRKNIAASLNSVNGMLAENRPTLKKTLDNVHGATEKLQPIMTNVHGASEKIAPMLDDLKVTIAQANQTLAHVDAMMAENSPDIRLAMGQLNKTLGSASVTVNLLQKTLDRNTENLDDLLVNLRETTENMNQLTDALKRNPSLLIRGETAKNRKPGENK
jgi:phospholipid/cholesterol/gamma-HCH transport system substrate-binding protein